MLWDILHVVRWLTWCEIICMLWDNLRVMRWADVVVDDRLSHVLIHSFVNGVKKLLVIAGKKCSEPCKKKNWIIIVFHFFFHFLKFHQKTLQVAQHHKLKFSWYFDFFLNSLFTLINVWHKKWTELTEKTWVQWPCWFLYFLDSRYQQTTSIIITYIFSYFLEYSIPIRVLPLQGSLPLFNPCLPPTAFIQ